jgi:hypothetical protein
MNETKTFDIHSFLTLSGRELMEYAESFLATEAPAMTLPTAEALVASLPSLDEEHLVYALELVMTARPEGFTDQLLTFLTHPRAAVCCTAYRLLSRVPQNSMPADFAKKVATVPIVELFTDDLVTGEKRSVGTNAEFIRSLMSKFA